MDQLRVPAMYRYMLQEVKANGKTTGQMMRVVCRRVDVA